MPYNWYPPTPTPKENNQLDTKKRTREPNHQTLTTTNRNHPTIVLTKGVDKEITTMRVYYHLQTNKTTNTRTSQINRVTTVDKTNKNQTLVTHQITREDT